MGNAYNGMTALEELIQFIKNMTPEQAEKLLKHPEFVAVMEGVADAV